MNNRHGRAQDIFKQVIAQAIIERFEANHPEYGIISVVSVEITSDHSYANIGLQSTGDTRELAKVLSKDSGEFRKILAKTLPIRRVPVLRFYDNSGIKSESDIYALLDQISKQSASQQDHESSHDSTLPNV